MANASGAYIPLLPDTHQYRCRGSTGERETPEPTMKSTFEILFCGCLRYIVFGSRERPRLRWLLPCRIGLKSTMQMQPLQPHNAIATAAVLVVAGSSCIRGRYGPCVGYRPTLLVHNFRIGYPWLLAIYSMATLAHNQIQVTSTGLLVGARCSVVGRD